jgi:uncharacterized protein (DUF4415 family)
VAKKQSASSVRGKHQPKNAKHIIDAKIDFSDIPELKDEQLYAARRVGRPKGKTTKQLIAFRINPNLLARLQKLAIKRKKPYQTLLHDLLEDAIDEAA